MMEVCFFCCEVPIAMSGDPGDSRLAHQPAFKTCAEVWVVIHNKDPQRLVSLHNHGARFYFLSIGTGNVKQVPFSDECDGPGGSTPLSLHDITRSSESREVFAYGSKVPMLDTKDFA